MISSVESGGTANAFRPRRRSVRPRPSQEIDLSRELHDHVSQTLNLLLLEMEMFKADQVGRVGVLREVDRMQASIRRVLANVRGILHEVRKDTATIDDLRPSLKALAERLAESCGAVVTVSVAQDWPDELHPAAAVDLIRILEEAAHNSAIHGAPTAIWIELSANPDVLTARVRDDGRGMISGITSPGLGIRGMRERASLLGGVLKITSEIGKGTETVLEIPRPPAMADIEAERMESA
jgi:two-component system, NarL family, sensor histidine kinase UhpB